MQTARNTHFFLGFKIIEAPKKFKTSHVSYFGPRADQWPCISRKSNLSRETVPLKQVIPDPQVSQGLFFMSIRTQCHGLSLYIYNVYACVYAISCIIFMLRLCLDAPEKGGNIYIYNIKYWIPRTVILMQQAGRISQNSSRPKIKKWDRETTQSGKRQDMRQWLGLQTASL